MQHELAKNMFTLVDGGLAAPTTPGLGIEIDENFVRRYAKT